MGGAMPAVGARRPEFGRRNEGDTMTARQHAWSTAVLGILAFSVPGCMGRLVGEGAERALGPKGAYWEEKPLAESKDDKVLAPYQRFELGEVTNDFGRNVPPEFFELFQQEFVKQLHDSKLPKGREGRTAVFNVHVIHYEKADTTDNVLGPLEQVVARVEIVDKDSGAVLATGNAVGRTGKTVGLGVDWKARGLAKALIRWASDYYPKASESDTKRKKGAKDREDVEDSEDNQDANDTKDKDTEEPEDISDVRNTPETTTSQDQEDGKSETIRK